MVVKCGNHDRVEGSYLRGLVTLLSRLQVPVSRHIIVASSQNGKM